MLSDISLSTWNINGLSNQVLGDKTRNKDFLDNISKYDFIFLTETWSNTVVDIPGFEAVSSCTAARKSNKGSRLSGGITLIFKDKFKNQVTIVKQSKNFLWCKISKNNLNSDLDLYFCGVYIPPENSTYFENEIFDELEDDLVSFSNKGNVMLLGDFNARTSKQEDFVSKEGSNLINDMSENSLHPQIRQSFDSTMNNHGKRLIDICKNTDSRILNGRTKGDSLGKPTFHGRIGTSVIDYIICDQHLFQNINYFIVKPPNYLSDHSQIVTWVNIHQTFETNCSNHAKSPLLHKLPQQFIWTENSKEIFTENLKSTKTQKQLEEFLKSDFHTDINGVNECVSQFENIILETSKKSLKIKNKKHRQRISNVASKKWFDKDCRIKRHGVRKLANQKHRDPLNITLREAYHATLKDYKDTLKQKKDEFHRNKIEEIEKSIKLDPKSFWKTLKTTSDDLEIDTCTTNTPSEHEWLTHFETLHSKHKIGSEQQHIINTLKNYENNKDQFDELDETITDCELLKAAKKLKTKKSAYSDKIRNEMIKSSVNILLNGYLKVFNLILKTGLFPSGWCEGLITPIFKSGNRLHPNDYRGICVSSCLGKFFSLILNERLNRFTNDNKSLHPSQIGFLPGNRTADHIFTLKTLNDKYVNQVKNGKIYACFVDFKKAFDSVWHEGLFLKLLENKIGGHFYDLIKNLYSNSKCAIKQSEHRTPFFSYSRGVRQGCILSPLLFNIYINELPNLFTETASDPFILPNGTKLSSLLYADDLIILSRSKHGLQNCLNQLHNWCNRWMMEVNLKKTNIMIFQKTTSKLQTPTFSLGNRMINVTQEYTYLGLKLTPNGKFTLALQQLAEKAVHAMYKIRRHLNFNSLSPKIAIKIFDSIISPILLYNSEIWGAYTNNDFNKWDQTATEKAHLKFCKIYLGVNKKSSNIACRGELGKLPLLTNIHKRVIKYVGHICNLPDAAIVKQAFIMSKELYISGKTSFYSNVAGILKSYDISNENLEAINNIKLKDIVNRMKEKYITFWRHKMSNSSKLSFYCSFKAEYKLEEYLTFIKNPLQRKIFTQFRISNHKLLIEYGRYQNIPREQRLCQLCDSNEVEDEYHFTLSCQYYQLLRDSSHNILKNLFNMNLCSETKHKLLQHIMSSTDIVLITLFSKFISLCFTRRGNCLVARDVNNT